MEIRNIAIAELNPAEYNPREISDFDASELRRSLTEFGMVEPAVVNSDMTIIGGHQRVEAAKQLGWTEVPCIVLEIDKRKEKALNLALNKIQGYFNEEKLANILKELETEAVGFSEEEINQYSLRAEISAEAEGKYNPDDDEELQKIFQRNEKVAVGVNEPGTPVRQDRIAFYVEDLDEFQAIREFFKTTRKGELDKDRLIGMINNQQAQKQTSEPVHDKRYD